MRRALRARAAQGAVLFDVGSFEALETAGAVPNVGLVEGSPFHVELHLSLPVAFAFDAPGAELIFRPFTPPGLELVDVSGSGFWDVNIEYIVKDAGAFGQEAPPGTAPAAFVPLVAIGAFMAAHWVGILLATIGISLSLGFLINAIRGRGFTDGLVPDVFGDAKDLIVIGIAAFVGFQLFNASKGRRARNRSG